MKPIKFYVVPRADIEHVTQDAPLPDDYLAEYEAARPGVLDDGTQDIFAANSRSERQRWTDFGLFQQVRDPKDADAVVCQNWLELLHSCRLDKGLDMVVQHVLHGYPDKVVVFSWNHDRDSASVAEFRGLPERALVLDYNTSKPWPNSVVLPFWNVETSLLLHERREHLAGFVGYVGSLKLRQRLEQAVSGRPDYYWTQRRVSEREYLHWMYRFRFALCPRGGGLNSYRFYEAIQMGAIPVLFGDDATLPFPDLDYSRFSLRIPERLAGDFDEINARLRVADWAALAGELGAVRQQFSLLGVQKEVNRRIRELVG